MAKESLTWNSEGLILAELEHIHKGHELLSMDIANI